MKGQASLPVSCPVCLHEPIVPDDCRPNKALRTTIKVFLKKKVMERETARKKEALEKAPATPDLPATPQLDQTMAPPPSETRASPPKVAVVDSSDSKQGFRDETQTPKLQHYASSKAEESVVLSEAQKDLPQQSIEVKPLTSQFQGALVTDFCKSPGAEIPRGASTQPAGDGSVGRERTVDNEKQLEQQQQQPLVQNELWAPNNMQGMNMGGFGFDGTNGGFPNIGFNGMGDFNQMMPFLPNGMPNPMMGTFPNMMGEQL